MIRSLVYLVGVIVSTPYAYGWFCRLTDAALEYRVAFLVVWLFGFAYVASAYHARKVQEVMDEQA